MTCSADKSENLQKAIAEVRKAAASGAQIVCLQELFTSLYFCDVEDYENFKLAEAIPGPSTEVLQKVAGELNVVIIASLFEKRAQGLYHNTTAVIDADGSYLGKCDNGRFYDSYGRYAWKIERGNIYDSSGRYSGKVSNNYFYNATGRYIGKYSAGRVYSYDGSYLGRIDSGRVYSSSGRYIGKAVNVPYPMIVIVYFIISFITT